MLKSIPSQYQVEGSRKMADKENNFEALADLTITQTFKHVCN